MGPITPIMNTLSQEFTEESELQYLKVLQETQLSRDLESQELCLLKSDFLSDLHGEFRQKQVQQNPAGAFVQSLNNDTKVPIVSVLESVNACFPMQA